MRHPTTTAQIGRLLATALVAALVAMGTGRAVPWLQILENAARDVRQILWGQTIAPPLDDIVVVAVSEDTLARFPYRSPVDRSFLADAVDAIATAGPKALGLDILFDRRPRRRPTAGFEPRCWPPISRFP